MEDTGEFNDIELEETGERYPQYDDMNYHDLLLNFDELINRLQREVKYGSDPLVATDLNSELSYVKKRMEELGTAQTTFTEGEEGTVNITGPSGSTAVPSVNFVEDPNNLLPDVLDAFNDSFNANWDDIEDRLSILKKFSEDRLTAEKKRDFENQVERVQANAIINELIKKTDENPECLSKLEGKVESIQYDLKTFSDDTVRMVTDILRKLSEL